jgi:hypothetical protein
MKIARAIGAYLTLPTVACLAGSALLCVGLAMLHPAAPWVAAGAILLLLGIMGATR